MKRNESKSVTLIRNDTERNGTERSSHLGVKALYAHQFGEGSKQNIVKFVLQTKNTTERMGK